MDGLIWAWVCCFPCALDETPDVMNELVARSGTVRTWLVLGGSPGLLGAFPLVYSDFAAAL